MIHFDLTFVYSKTYESNLMLYIWKNNVPALFIEKIIISPPNLLYTYIKN